MEQIHPDCPLRAKDVMSTKIITLSPNDTLDDALQAILDHSISGAPVTDGEGRIVGVISEFALMDLLFSPQFRDAPVSKFMTTDVQTVQEDDAITTLAHIFALYRIRRLPVVRDGLLTGIVSRRDILREFRQSNYVLAEPLFQAPLVEIEDCQLEKR